MTDQEWKPKLCIKKKGYYRCYMCDEKFKQKSSVRRHFSNIHSTPDQVYKPVVHASGYDHKLCERLSSGQRKCYKCESIFSTPGSMKTHFDATHAPTPVVYKCEYCDFSTNYKYNLPLHSCYKQKTGTTKVSESTITRRLQQEEKGKGKKCSVGYIDVLTKTQIIEVKNWAFYYKAIGQIIMYSSRYPKRQKRIHFFGRKPDEDKIQTIVKACEKYDILITYESDDVSYDSDSE